MYPCRTERYKISQPSIAIAVMAAGKSSRMGAHNKMLAVLDGVALVRRAVETAIAAGRGKVIVVTGHMADAVADCIDDLPVQKVFNPTFMTGLASSLKCALRTTSPTCSGVLVHLADMPEITASQMRALCDVFEENNGNCIVRAVSNGKRGNPVILPRALFDAVFSLEGDVGAHAIIEGSGLSIHEVELGKAASMDIDTIDILHSLGGSFSTS